MAFLDEVDSLKAKLGIGSINPLMLVGICLVLVVVVVGVLAAAWGSFTSPGIVVEHVDEAQGDGGEEGRVSASIFVHVAGEVESPGMYELEKGARVSDAVQAAGGMLEGADQLSVNLARELADGEQVVISSKAALADGSESQSPNEAGMNAGQAKTSNGKVNINSASANELTALDGIGQATAEKIIAYRQANGSFSSIEDIKKVSGIGDKKFEAIKDRIVV